ncbi:MAG: RsmE family RNA methyltransferase [Halanaerobiales bacterium]
MNRFFVKSEYIDNDVVEISGDDFNHISNSLRLKVGEKIIISTGDGYDFIVKLSEFKENSVVGRIIEKRANKSEPNINIDLAQAVPKNRNIEFVIQKGTEIGANNIIPIDTERTIVKLSRSKEKRRNERWQAIAEEAAKQSQRGKIPKILDLISLEKKGEVKELIRKYDLVLVLFTGEVSKSIKYVIREHKNNKLNDILLFIGPEGGFTKGEVEMFEKIDSSVEVEKISLGPRILRTETAGIVALSAILYEFDGLGG